MFLNRWTITHHRGPNIVTYGRRIISSAGYNRILLLTLDGVVTRTLRVCRLILGFVHFFLF
jgi:hypothetical protein